MINLSHITLSINNQLLIENGQIEIKRGYMYMIEGESGSGKTTLLYELSLLSSYSKTQYIWDDQRIDLLNQKQKDEIRRFDIGYIMQDLEIISERLSLKENIECLYALINKVYDESQVLKYLHELHLDISLNDYPSVLSRGQRQRFALILALIKDADLIVCDEPTSALDEYNAREFLKILKYICKTYHKMIIIASHDSLVKQYVDCLYCIENNQLIKKYTSDDDHQYIKNKNYHNIHKSFYKIFNKNLFQSKLLIHMIYILLVCLLCLSPVILDHLLDKNKELYSLFSSSGFIIKDDLQQDFNDSTMTLIKEIENVKDVYIYQELDGVINNNEIDIKIIPRLDIEQYHISSSLSQIIISNTQLTIYYNNQYYNDVINDYIIKDYPNKDISQNIIYVPISKWNQIIDSLDINNSSILLIHCNDINNTMDEIKQWVKHIQISSDLLDNEKQIQLLNDIKQYIIIIEMIIICGSILLAYVTTYLDYKKRMNEIIHLRINGFNEYQFIYLLINENKIIVTIILLLTTISYLFIDYHIINIFKFILNIIINLLITKVIPLFVISKKIFSKDISILLRSRL